MFRAPPPTSRNTHKRHVQEFPGPNTNVISGIATLPYARLPGIRVGGVKVGSASVSAGLPHLKQAAMRSAHRATRRIGGPGKRAGGRGANQLQRGLAAVLNVSCSCWSRFWCLNFRKGQQSG